VSFHGAKLALIRGDDLIVILRDNIPTIPWPGHWDFPGGGREGDETPLDCALRELREELSFDLDPNLICWAFSGPNATGETSWFFVARVDDLDLSAVRLGDEGQEWRLMPINQYLDHALTIPSLRTRLTRWISTQNGT
jgi:8-oxo-dGTP diphosphatase